MVCRAFLRCIGVDFAEAELCIGSHEPIDIGFGQAAFQITEVLNEGRRRGVEHQERETKYRNARGARDVMEPWSNPAPMKFPEMVSATAKRLGHKFDKLGYQGCQGIDALVYINLVDLRSGVYRYLFPAEFSQTDDVAKSSITGLAFGFDIDGALRYSAICNRRSTIVPSKVSRPCAEGSGRHR